MPEFEIKGNDTGAKGENKEGKKSNKLIKTLKKKPFLIACIGVVILGLFAWWRNSQNKNTHQNMLVADGYDSLQLTAPTGMESGIYTGGTYSSGTYEAMADEFLAEMEKVTNSFENQLKDMSQSYEVEIDSMSEQVQTLSNRVNYQENTINEQSEAIARQNAIDTMKANSDAWHYATTEAEKKALADANSQIASQYGWTRNESDGYWYDGNGQRVYSTVTQEQNSVSVPNTKKASSTGSTSSKKTTSSGGTSKSTNTSTGSTTKVDSVSGKTYSTTTPSWLDFSK